MQEWQTLCAPDKSPLLQRTRAKQEKYISLALQTPKSARLRGSGMGKHRLERGLFGQLGCCRREASTRYARLFRASAANLSALRAQRQVQPHICSGARGGRRQSGPASGPANTAPGRVGAELPDGFLCRCPFERASKPNESLARDPQYIIVCVPVLDFAAVKIRLQRFYRFEGMRHGGKLERARQKG